MRITIEAEGFEIDEFSADEERLNEVAYELASDIGMRLADLGSSSRHGRVTIWVGENGSMKGNSDSF